MRRDLTREQAAEMGRKGGRAGKGRKAPQTVAKIDAREALRKKIEADMEPLYEAWKDTAVGHFMQVKLETGEMKVYKKAPNPMAIRDMFVQAFGNPNQPHTVEFENFCDVVDAIYANARRKVEGLTKKS